MAAGSYGLAATMEHGPDTRVPAKGFTGFLKKAGWLGAHRHGRQKWQGPARPASRQDEPAIQALRILRPAVLLAQEMGTLLG